jgi:FixJ family two-component response regulator
MKSMTSIQPTVFLVEDDPSYQTALERLLRAARMPCKAFGSAEDFLKNRVRLGPGCILLDIQLPGIGGLDRQRVLASLGSVQPIIFLTSQSDLATGMRAMKAGAVDFLTKPVQSANLLAAIKRAFDVDAANRQAGPGKVS